jgi:hypothetical protein
MQWEKETSNGKYDRAWSVYRSAIYARFHNQYQQETAYKVIMEVQYKGSIQDMITEYNTLKVKAGITGVAHWTMLMRGRPPQIFKQQTTVNPVDKTDDELREIILTSRKNIEVWQATERNFGIINKPSKSMGRISKTGALQKHPTFKQSRKFENRRPQQIDNYQTKRKDVSWTFKSPGGKTYSQMVEGVPKNQIDRTREAKEYLRCAWPTDRKGANRMIKCF